MSHGPLRAALVVGALLLVPPAATAAVPTGPAGTAFYTPAMPLGGTKHGDLLRARPLSGGAALPGAARNVLLLHRGTGVDGRPTAISGALAIPRGKAPKGGWPVVTFAHGTTGLADDCAPTRPDGARLSSYAHPTLTRWLERGWAVVRTDYEGLGGPGVHPYLVGTSEGRAVLDVVRAARQQDRRLSASRVLIAGHSQGGHAALWAASLAARYTPELRIRGTVGFAPESHTGEQAQLIGALTDPSPLTGLAASILRGVEVQDPTLQIRKVLSPAAGAKYGRIDTRCLDDVVSDAGFGRLAPADLLREGADTTRIVAALNANDSETVTIRTPVRVEQGLADNVVFPMFTDQLVDALRKRGTTVDVAKRAGVDHAGIVAKGAVASTAWMAQRLK